MLKRFLLEFAHCLVRMVHRRLHLRAIAVLGLNGVREPGIVGAQLQFQRLPADGEARLDRFDPGLLARIQVKLLVQQAVQFGLDGRLPRDIGSTDERPRNRGSKGD